MQPVPALHGKGGPHQPAAGEEHMLVTTGADLEQDGAGGLARHGSCGVVDKIIIIR